MNLSTITKQEAFDTMLTHLREQRLPAIDQTLACLYRDPNGYKCAVGCLIPDDLYNDSLENQPMEEIVEHIGMNPEIASFLRAAQTQMHDKPSSIYIETESEESFMQEVEAGAKLVAQIYNLTYTGPAA